MAKACDLLFDFVGRTERHQVLYIKSGENADSPTVFSCDLFLVHRILLDGMDHVKTNLDEILQEGFDIAAAVQPEMGAERVRLFDQLAVVGLEKFPENLQREKGTVLRSDTLDECPMAYKEMQDIVDNIGPTVDILKVIRPIYNFKAGEED